MIQDQIYKFIEEKLSHLTDQQKKEILLQIVDNLQDQIMVISVRIDDDLNQGE